MGRRAPRNRALQRFILSGFSWFYKRIESGIVSLTVIQQVKGGIVMGMYSALMQEIEKGLDDIKKSERKVVEVTRRGKIVSSPFNLFQKKTEEMPAKACQSSK